MFTKKNLLSPLTLDLGVVVVPEPIDGHIDGWDNEDVGEVEHIIQQPQAGGTMSVFKCRFICQ